MGVVVVLNPREGCEIASSLDRDAHGAGGAGDDLRRLVDVVGVEVFLLGLGDLADLIEGDLADLLGVRLARALLQTGCLEQQLRGGAGA